MCAILKGLVAESADLIVDAGGHFSQTIVAGNQDDVIMKVLMIHK